MTRRTRGDFTIQALRPAALCLFASGVLAACSTPSSEPGAADDRATLQRNAEKFEADLAARGLIYVDPELASYVDSVVAPLAEQSPLGRGGYRVALLRDPTPNAFALPNDAIYVHAGAVVTAEDEAQLAATFIADQQFWGRRIAELSCGPAPIPFRKLTVESLAERIRALVETPAYREGAAALLRV